MNKQALKTYLEDLLSRGGTQAEIARKCGVSSTAISQFLSGTYGAKEDALTAKIARGMNYHENAWAVVPTVASYRQIQTAYRAAKHNSTWVCISSRSGSGKTASLIDLYNTAGDNSVVYLKCRQWSKRKFLTKLCIAFGLEVPRSADCDDMLDAIATEVDKRADRKPLLMIDDAGKLTHSARQMLIPLYDDNLHRMGAIVAGTETLERSIKRGVGSIEGYDEIDGRFMRHYISLLGASKKDVLAICAANGVSNREAQELIWGKLRKVSRQTEEGGRAYAFVDDLRELSGMIRNELIQEQIRKGEL